MEAEFELRSLHAGALDTSPENELNLAHEVKVKLVRPDVVSDTSNHCILATPKTCCKDRL